MADILIRMDMPKRCIDCPCMVDKYGGDNCCLQSEEANEKITSWDDMKAGCPLIKLPEHGDLISREQAFRMMLDRGYQKKAAGVILEVPTVIPSSKEESE